MTNIFEKAIQVAEGIFAPEAAEIEAFAETVKNDVVDFIRAEEAAVQVFAKDAVTQISNLIKGASAAQLQILQGLVKTAAADAAVGDYTAIASAVIQQATTAELAWVAQLGVQFIGAWAAIWSFSPATPSA